MNDPKKTCRNMMDSLGGCIDSGCEACHQSEKPQPEQWFKELEIYKKSATEAIMTFDPRHTFCTVCGTDPEALVARLNEVVASLLLAQKEQMLEAVREMNGYKHMCESREGHACEYESALSDVEEKLKGL